MGVILVSEQNGFAGTFRIARSMRTVKSALATLLWNLTSGAHNGEPGFGERMGAKLAVGLILVSLPKERVCRP